MKTLLLRLPKGLHLIFAVAYTLCIAGTASAQTQFLLLSDIHFDPYEDQALFDDLAAAPASGWPAIFAQSASTEVSQYGSDSNYALFESALEAAQKALPNPEFIVYPGDFLAHEWTSKYDSFAPQSHSADPHAYQQFTAKVIQYMANRFRAYFPKAPIFPTLGNDDALCGDYMVEPEGVFLTDFSTIWAPLLGSTVAPKAFRSSFRKGGYYTASLPTLSGYRLVVLNSIFFDIDYANNCGLSTETPALDELNWLEDTLESASQDGEKVWLLMHVPPGINAYSSESGIRQGGAPVSFWQSIATSHFSSLLQKYPKVLSLAFAGHTHMDDFRVAQQSGKSVFLTKIAPSVSPIFYNNPGFQVFSYDTTSGELLDYDAHYLANLSTSGAPTNAADLHWKLEYNFGKTYRESAITATTMTRVAKAISSAGSQAEKSYTEYYPSLASPQFDTTTVEYYSCALLQLTQSEYSACLSTVGSP